MAKISARGATKVLELVSDIPNDIAGTGGVTRYIHVLRSDGAVLRSSSFPQHPAGAYDRKRSSYRIVGRVPHSSRDKVASFTTYHNNFTRALSK